MDVNYYRAEFDRLEVAGDWKGAGELAFALADVAKKDGKQALADEFGQKALEIYEAHCTETDTLEGAAPSQQCVRIGPVEVPLPSWMHAGIVRNRLGLALVSA